MKAFHVFHTRAKNTLANGNSFCLTFMREDQLPVLLASYTEAIKSNMFLRTFCSSMQRNCSADWQFSRVVSETVLFCMFFTLKIKANKTENVWKNLPCACFPSTTLHIFLLVEVSATLHSVFCLIQLSFGHVQSHSFTYLKNSCFASISISVLPALHITTSIATASGLL